MAPSAPASVTDAGRPVTVTEPPVPAHLNIVVAGGAVDGHAIGRAVAHVTARCRREIDRDLGDAGAGEVADIDVVGAAESGEIDVLDAVEIHRDVGDVAGELHPAVVGRDADVLVDVGAVEYQRIGAVLAFDGVAAVARIPDEGVVAGAAEQRVVAAAAGDDVIAVAADQRVVAVAAGDGVVAVAAVDGEADQGCEAVAGGEDVVAAVHVKHEILGGADVERERRRAEAIETHAAAVGGEGKVFGAVAAVDLGGVDAVAALHQVGALARIPDHAVVAGLAEHLVVAGAADQRVVAVAAEQQIVAALALQNVVARAAEQQIVAGAADQRVVAGAAEQLDGGQRTVGFVDRDRVVAAWPNTWISPVLATVGWPPTTATAPPLMRMFPAASRLAMIVLSWLSSITDSTPVGAEKLAVVAM